MCFWNVFSEVFFKLVREWYGIIYWCLVLKKSYNVKIYMINLCNRF